MFMTYLFKCTFDTSAIHFWAIIKDILVCNALEHVAH